MQGARFIREASQKENPFFLFMSYNAPHTPIQAKKEDLEKLRSIKDEKRRTYAAMVHAVDRGVKNIVDELKEMNKFKNTLIVFLSDNGGVTKHGASNAPLQGRKGDTWEGGYRTPMFFHWPEKIPKQLFPYTVTALDFYPTFTALAKANVPDEIELDGKDIWQDVISGSNPRKAEPLFVMRHRGKGNEIGVRLDDWKLFRRGNSWKLFDVSNDIGEKNDLSQKHPDQLRSMIQMTADWVKIHSEPQWFDSFQARDMWVENDRPDFEKTFRILNADK
jgi:arylsulfatase A-like enzyme